MTNLLIPSWGMLTVKEKLKMDGERKREREMVKQQSRNGPFYGIVVILCHGTWTLCHGLLVCDGSEQEDSGSQKARGHAVTPSPPQALF